MAEIKPEIKVVKQKPPAEPPPSQEITEEEKQWLEDIQAPAKEILQEETTAKISILSNSKYHPQATSQRNDEENHNHRLQQIINRGYLTKHPQINKLLIPTPKSSRQKVSQYDESNWMDNESVEWIQHNEQWKAKTLHNNLD